MQPGPTGRSEYADLRKRVARRLRDGRRLVLDLAPRVERHLEPAAVHDLRVATRRLRALVWVVRRVGPWSACKRLRRMLRVWGQALGERRTLDVVMESAAEMKIDASPLTERYGHSAEAVRAAITAEGAAELAILLGKAADRVPDWSEHRLHQGLVLCAQELRKALRDAPSGKEHQHLLRIEAKKTRYVLEAVGRTCDPLKELQSLLGESHDMEILQLLLGPHPLAAEVEARARDAAVGLMREAVEAAEEELRAEAARLRGQR